MWQIEKKSTRRRMWQIEKQSTRRRMWQIERQSRRLLTSNFPRGESKLTPESSEAVSILALLRSNVPIFSCSCTSDFFPAIIVFACIRQQSEGLRSHAGYILDELCDAVYDGICSLVAAQLFQSGHQSRSHSACKGCLFEQSRKLLLFVLCLLGLWLIHFGGFSFHFFTSLLGRSARFCHSFRWLS